MKGDFSRITFQSRKHYSDVLHQQGRVWLDADWNEDVCDRQFLHDQETIDTIGVCGVPDPGTAFKIGNPVSGAQPFDFTIGGGPGSQGHCYVDGLLCQLESSVTYLTQPDFPNPPAIAMPAPGATVTALVYLEVWQRLITYLEDPDIREVALNGPDTATRLKTIAQVKAIPVASGTVCAQAVLPTSGRGTLTTLQPPLVQPPDPCRIPDPASFTGRENHLYRVEVHDDGDVLGGVGQAQTILLASDVAASAVTLVLSQALSVAQGNALQQGGTILVFDDDAAMDRIPVSGVSADRKTISLSRGTQTALTAARNARVTVGAAHFKWSRDNASFAVSVTGISADRKTLTVASLGRDQATALRLGDIVEITDDVTELGPSRGHLTYLSGNPDPDQFLVSLLDPLPGNFALPTATTPDRHIVLRRWDGIGSASTAFNAQNTPDMDFGDGVHVQFGGQDLRAGDFWRFTARSVDGSVQPLLNQLPEGIIRHRCPLAIVTWITPAGTAASSISSIEDCRRIFPPLTAIFQPGIHVTGIFAVDNNGVETPLDNDTVVDVTRITGGIHVQCDALLDGKTISRATAFVTVEAPFPPAGAGPPSGYQAIALRSTLGVANQIILWRPTAEAQALMSALTTQIPTDDLGVLTRLTLKGNFIWDQSATPLFLDGEVFGVRKPGAGNTSLQLPSGDRRRGGDFEMWFFLARQAPPAPLLFTFTAATTPSLRAEGIAELVGDLLLTGKGGTPTPAGTTVPVVNITLFFNTQITSPLLGTQQDAILLIDDPTRLNTGPASALIGQAGGLDFKGGTAPNVFIGQQAAGTSNSVTFFGVPIDPPGGNGKRLLRFKNIRVNASALGVSSSLVPTPVVAAISVSGAASVPISGPQAVVASVLQGATFGVVNAAGAGTFTINPRVGVNTKLAQDSKDTTGVINIRLQFQEAFPTAFKIQTDGLTDVALPLAIVEEEAFDNLGTGAVPVTGAPLPQVGRATSGTRLMATFLNVPAGVQIFVTTRDVPAQPSTAIPPPKAILVAADSSGAGGGTGALPPNGTPVGSGGSTGGIPIAAISVAGGSGSAVWEWVSTDPASPLKPETVEFGVLLAAAVGGNAPPLALGTATVTLSLAPVSNNVTASPVVPVPRFVRTSPPQPAFVVANPFILFPFVTNILNQG